MSQTKIKNNPTFNVVLGGVYEYVAPAPLTTKDTIIVESFTAYDSEGELLGTEDFPIYHAIVRVITEYKHQPSDEQSNLRLSPEFIATYCKYVGVRYLK